MPTNVDGPIPLAKTVPPSYPSSLKLYSLGVILLSALACATNPATGKKDLVLVSEAQEIEMGGSADRQVTQSMGLYDDEDLASYVSDIGLRLATLRGRTCRGRSRSSTRQWSTPSRFRAGTSI